MKRIIVSFNGIAAACLLTCSVVIAAQTHYMVPSTPADDSQIHQIISDAGTLVSQGIYDGIDPSGAACTIQVEFRNGPHEGICLSDGDCEIFRIYSYRAAELSLPRLDQEGAFGPPFLPYYSFKAPNGVSDGEMDLVIAQNTGTGNYGTLVEYRVMGKNGVPSSISGAFGFGVLPIQGKTISVLGQYPTCSKLNRRTQQ